MAEVSEDIRNKTRNFFPAQEWNSLSVYEANVHVNQYANYLKMKQLGEYQFNT